MPKLIIKPKGREKEDELCIALSKTGLISLDECKEQLRAKGLIELSLGDRQAEELIESLEKLKGGIELFTERETTGAELDVGVIKGSINLLIQNRGFTLGWSLMFTLLTALKIFFFTPLALMVMGIYLDSSVAYLVDSLKRRRGELSMEGVKDYLGTGTGIWLGQAILGAFLTFLIYLIFFTMSAILSDILLLSIIFTIFILIPLVLWIIYILPLSLAHALKGNSPGFWGAFIGTLSVVSPKTLFLSFKLSYFRFGILWVLFFSFYVVVFPFLTATIILLPLAVLLTLWLLCFAAVEVYKIEKLLGG